MIRCRHHACQCARAAELAAMGLLPEAIDVHYEEVECRRVPRKVKDSIYTFGGILGARALGYPADWPRCPGCGEPALDGHITCGKAECDEGGRR